jgi:hypothetical protein
MNIRVQEADPLTLKGEAHRQVDGDGALAYPAFAGQDDQLMFDLL